MARIDIHLGGIAAERVVFGHHSTSGGGGLNSDLRIATELATTIESHFGFGESLVLDMGSGQRALEDMRARDPELRKAVDRRLRSSLDKTEAILADHRDTLDVLAALLTERGNVSGDEVRDLMAARGDRMGLPVPDRKGTSVDLLGAKSRKELKR